MTTNIGDALVPYNKVQIPTLEDDADIRAALRVYHYGANVSDPDNAPEGVFENSIAGELLSLENSKRNISIETISAGTNLDTKTVPGVYYASALSIGSGTNYPLIDGNRKAGFLFVESYGEVVVQKYVTVDSVAALNGVMFIRTRTLVGQTYQWLPATWQRLSDSTHIHDDRYTQTIVLRPELDNKPNQINGKNASGIDLSGTRKIIIAAPVEVNGEQIPNITPAQQASLQPGDIWFW